MPLRQKKLLTVFITHKNHDFKKAVLVYCIAEARSAQRRLGLHSGSSLCLANLEGSCLHSRGSWRPGVFSLVLSYAKSCGIQTYICNKKAGFICCKFLYQISIKFCVHQEKTILQNVCTVRGFLTILKARSGLMQWTTLPLCTAAVVKITSKSFQIIS